MTLVCALVVVVAASVVAKPKQNEAAIVAKAEFIIELSWPDGSINDIDLYARGPDKRVVYFGNMRSALMHLDVDNRGVNNALPMPDGTTKQILDRREILTIRSCQPGSYTTNVHAYRWRGIRPEQARVRIIKVNPYRDVVDRTLMFDAERQEQTVATFIVNRDCTVGTIDQAQQRMVR
jgi:hypothetical protein